jgi:hypothetical protein
MGPQAPRGEEVTDESCTEIVYRFDFPNPPTLLQVWRDYIHEHARRRGQEINRVVYLAKHWLRVMGIDSTPGAWKRADVRAYEDQRRSEGVMATTIRREMCLMQAAMNHALKWERIERVATSRSLPARVSAAGR